MASMRMGTKVGEDTTTAAALSTADHYVRVVVVLQNGGARAIRRNRCDASVA
jgi:hypothetical protein